MSVEIVTARLLLREFRADDWAAVLAYQSDPRYQRYYERGERTAGDARAFVRMFIAQQEERPRRKWQLAIVLPEEGCLIGNCGIRTDPARREADIGYELDPRYWGHGYATEAARALLRFGFDNLGLHRITAWCIAENTASARVLERLGMRCEGRLRENEWMQGRWWDTLAYAILDREWRAREEAAGAA
jgi:RimJ/RimL family protein N-acetyltransferase